MDNLKVNASELFKWNRLDLPIKLLYLKYKGINTSFGDEIYKKHLELWNGFKEYDNPSKNSYEAFTSAFNSITQDIRDDNFNWDLSPLIVDDNVQLMNGAHRCAASAFLNKKIAYQLSTSPVDGQVNCNFELFKNLGLNSEYLDEAALELVRTNPNYLIVSLFPSATKDRHLVNQIITKYCNIAYQKDVYLNSNGAFNYTLQLYKGESWAGGWNNNFGGFRSKTRQCFTNNNHPMTVYLIDLTNLETARQLKNEIRALYNIGNHSVHINDTSEETLRLARCLFNKNSIHFLNYSQLQYYPKFLEQLHFYENYIKENNLNFEDYCITASSVLSLYGLREGNDLDYLHFDPTPIKGHHDVHSHNDYGLTRYKKPKDDIIFNPKNHFYYGNLKVASLEIVKQLKCDRGEHKDMIDIKLINQVI